MEFQGAIYCLQKGSHYVWDFTEIEGRNSDVGGAGHPKPRRVLGMITIFFLKTRKRKSPAAKVASAGAQKEVMQDFLENELYLMKVKRERKNSRASHFKQFSTHYDEMRDHGVCTMEFETTFALIVLDLANCISCVQNNQFKLFYKNIYHIVFDLVKS